MSEETGNVEMGTFDQLVRVGFPQGTLEFHVTTHMAMLIQDAFMTGTTIGLAPADAALKAGATFVGLNGSQMLMCEIIPYKEEEEQKPTAQIIQAVPPKLVIPKGVSVERNDD